MLAARVQPTVPTIQPRRAARFLDPSGFTGLSAERPAPWSGQPLPSPGHHAAGPQNIGLPKEAEAPAQSRPGSALTESRHFDRPIPAEAALPTPAPVVIRELVTQRETTVREVPTPVAAVVAPVLRAEFIETLPVRSETTLPSIPEPPLQPRPAVAESPPTARPESPVPPPRVPTAIVPRLELTRPPEAVHPASPSQRGRESAPPRIEVTIGCVEVRAFTAAAATAPPRPPVREPSAPVSLSDYLRQRRSARS